MAFDFTLIGFRKLGVQGATNEWLREFSEIGMTPRERDDGLAHLWVEEHIEQILQAQETLPPRPVSPDDPDPETVVETNPEIRERDSADDGTS